MEVRLLGSVELVEGDRVVRITAAKQRALLALLALQANRVVSLETLVDRLWEQPPPSAAHAVGVYVSELRRRLGSRETLRSRKPGYLIDLPVEAVDALRFEQLYRAALASIHEGELRTGVAELRAALELWTGPALADAREGSLRIEAERLDESRLIAYEACLDAELRLGQLDTVLVDAERLLAEHPLRPQLVRIVMLARFGGGREAGALAAYRDHRHRLDSELGLPPDPSLRALETAILRGELPPPSTVLRSPPPKSLPVQPTVFVGRVRELIEVADLLAREDVRLLTLTGPGGVGKTRLALQVATSLADRGGDGAFFVSLAPLSDPELVISAVAEKLGVRERSGESLTASVARHLAERELLLVLDNFEQVSAAADAVATLLATAPRLRVLVTSRTPLGLRGEQLYDLSPLGVPSASDGLDAILGSDAVRLFERRAQAVDPEFLVDERNAAAVAEVCRRLDGLPLAVELAASRVRVLPPKTMLGRLDKRLHFLAAGGADAEPRQRTIGAAISWSFELLQPEEQALFARLGVFVGGFRLDAAEAVIAAEHELALDVLDGVSSLVAHSLVRRWDDPDDEPRFWMLETIREFAVRQLERDGLLERFRRLHALYFADLAEQAEPELWGTEQAAWSSRLDSDQNNLRAAVAWAVTAGDGVLALRLSGALEPYWETRGQIAEGERWLFGALEAGSAAPPESRAKALFGVSRLVEIEGDYVRERGLLEEASDLFRDASDSHGLTFALAHLGYVLGRLGEHAAAAASSMQAVELARQLDDRWLLAMALNCRGMALIDAGRYEPARTAIEESLSIRRALGEKRGIAVTLDSLGMLLIAEGRAADALAPLEEALSLVRQLGNVALEAPILTSLGLATLNTADFERARTVLTQSLVICREIPDREAISGALVGLAALELERDRERALDLWALAVRLRAQLASQPLAHVLPVHARVEQTVSVWSHDAIAEHAVDEQPVDAALARLLRELLAEDRTGD